MPEEAWLCPGCVNPAVPHERKPEPAPPTKPKKPRRPR